MQMKAMYKDLSSEEPGGDGKSEQAEDSEPSETSLTRETNTMRRTKLKRLETERRDTG